MSLKVTHPKIEICRDMEEWCLEQAKYREYDTLWDFSKRAAFKEMAAWLQSKRASLGDAP